MSEKLFGEGNKPPIIEVPEEKKVIAVNEIILTGEAAKLPEGERHFSENDIRMAMQELGIVMDKVDVTIRVVNREGKIISLTLRTHGSNIGYTFDLIGRHAPGYDSRVTALSRDEYKSGEVFWSDNIADYVNGVWVKKMDI